MFGMGTGMTPPLNHQPIWGGAGRTKGEGSVNQEPLTGCPSMRLLMVLPYTLLLMKKEEGASQATRAISTARLMAHAICTCRLSTW